MHTCGTTSTGLLPSRRDTTLKCPVHLAAVGADSRPTPTLKLKPKPHVGPVAPVLHQAQHPGPEEHLGLAQLVLPRHQAKPLQQRKAHLARSGEEKGSTVLMRTATAKAQVLHGSTGQV